MDGLGPVSIVGTSVRTQPTPHAGQALVCELGARLSAAHVLSFTHRNARISRCSYHARFKEKEPRLAKDKQQLVRASVLHPAMDLIPFGPRTFASDAESLAWAVSSQSRASRLSYVPRKLWR